MSDTTQTPGASEPKGTFNGRSFVSDDAPAGESTSPAAGNDDATTDEPVEGEEEHADESPEGDEGEDGDDAEGDQDGEGEGVDGEPEKLKTAWDQTPDEKRRERFNETFEHSNKQATENAALKAELARLKGEAPAGDKKDAPKIPTAEEIMAQALNPETKELTAVHRDIRRLSVEVAEYKEKELKPAAAAEDAAKAEVDKVNERLTKKQHALDELIEDSKGREGVYDTEITRKREEIRDLKVELSEATNKFRDARDAHRDAKSAHADLLEKNRQKADKLASTESAKRQAAVDEAASRTSYQTEYAKSKKVWDDTAAKVISELKIDAKFQKAAANHAWLEGQAIAKARGKDNPVTEKEYRKIILDALKPLSPLSEEEAGRVAATNAERRKAATTQEAPKKRLAKTARDGKPQSVEEAEAALKHAFKASRARINA